MPTSRISIVIPAYNEEVYLPRLLAGVATARARYLGGAETLEVIVADIASTDGTARVALERGCGVIPVAKRVIAEARNAGAGVARGAVLGFVDADARLLPAACDAFAVLLAERRDLRGAQGMTR